MFEMLILLVVIVLAWWVLTSLAMLVTRGLRRVRLDSQDSRSSTVRKAS
ncbi:MAG: hypothetical protein AAGF46_13190 [Pseudomonadota bacterium]